jgi:hypothetical protein
MPGYFSQEEKVPVCIELGAGLSQNCSEYVGNFVKPII